MTQARATVLVVDDEPLLRTIMSEWLELEGYRVLTAKHGADALLVQQATSIDAIVTDIRMPVMDGVTFLKALMASSGSFPPVILVSGYTDTTPREAHALGAPVILSKPFTEEELMSAVRRVLIPRETLWRAPAEGSAVQALQTTFGSVDSARQLGQLSFGSGGFCVRSPAILRQGPVRFALNFSEQPLGIAGQGVVQWVQPAEQQIGIEITALEAPCLALCVRLTAGARCYIPRASNASTLLSTGASHSLPGI